ncbi:MAG: DEAD/DEAH box helicase family protein [Buchananella hordeovulneris]|nr:DEAD/DEAH box helicase family protein [Buchananella hordeovulneris]
MADAPPAVENPPACWRFTGTFRAYQQRVLVESPAHLKDGRLHVVAAPGSGKTILGLELAGRLGAPTLVLSPSLAIRDQWVARLQQNFAPPAGAHSCSTSLLHPGALTSATYQSLFAAFNRLLDEESGESFAGSDLLELLGDVGTVILDEAHHLRTQWHRALEAFLAQLRLRRPELKIIALTATPPYDTTEAQWRAYEELCGRIDAQISVPELIASGDLAPHQDYVLINAPAKAELDQLAALRAGTKAVLRDLAAAGAPALLANGALASQAALHIDECLDDEVGAVGFLHLARYFGHEPDANLTHLLDAGSLEASVEDGMQFVLAHPHLFSPALVGALADSLRAHRLLDAKGVVHRSALAARRLLLNSVGKLDSIAQIAAQESDACGKSLRMLVLADHIRAEYVEAIGTAAPLPKLGVVPAFEAVRRALLTTHPELAERGLAVLTGSCVLFPAAALEGVAEFCRREGTEFAASPLPHCQQYVRLSFAGGSQSAVKVLTAAFACGQISILVGTAALLGEGWDCPQLDTLVLASTIKATMMTNQMRGRTIRIDPAAPGKVANIWHLATADVDHLFVAGQRKEIPWLSHDVRKLLRRFGTFVGPHATLPRVESGLERCASREELWYRRNPQALNRDNLLRSKDRARCRELWHQAIALRDVNSARGLDLAREVRTTLRPVRVRSAIDLLLAAAFTVWVFLLVRLASAAYSLPSDLLSLVLAIGTLPLAGLWLASFLLRRRFFDPRRRTLAQAGALLATLQASGAIESTASQVLVEQGANAFELSVSLSTASLRDQEVFADAVAELFAPVRSPRYLLVPAWAGLLGRNVLVQNVPQAVGVNRTLVDVFVDQLKARGLPVRAHYTRSEQGRAHLLRARSLAAVNHAQGASRVYWLLRAQTVGDLDRHFPGN